ncbi:MAG: hypothetical protein U0L74_03565, partial [Paludibacteraceae bacterium]|nr:hypothetical protein [Paludibacteraceae bacterium]
NSSVATYEVPVFADKAGDKGAYLELSAVVSTGEGACSQQLVLGVAKVYALKREHFNVRLVPFRRDEIENTKEIEEKLNKIYKPLGKTFTVKGEERFGDGADFDFLADGLNLLNESSFGVETEEMTMLKFAYDELRGFSKENVYLFVLPKANMDGVTGFMPRGKHVGYLFCGENETIDERTVAHELGHGLFTLEHAFDYIDGSPVGSTNNLMDYSDGTNLKVWQWNHMDTHGPVLPFFDDAEDAMANALVAFVQKIQTCLDGKDITFFKNVRECRNCGTWGYTVAIVRDAISLPREEAYAAFCVMSCFLESAKIPERFWNAERNDYYFKAVDDRVANLFVSMMDKLVFKGNGENPAANSVFSAISGTGKCQFALCCGAYNAVVDLLKDVTETGEMLTQDPQKMYEGFVEALNSLENVTFEAIGESLITNLKEFHGFGKSGFNQYKAAYSVGYDVVTAASFFVGIGEISAVAKGANAGKVVMASVKASARQAKQIASGAVSGAKQLLKKSDDILKATEKFSQNIRSVCNDVVSQVLEKGIDVKIDIKNLSSDLKSVVISCALNTLEFTKDAVNISKKVDDVSEILYVAAENIKVYNKATKETFDATVALSKNAVVLISPELMNCVLKYGAKLKNVDKFKKIFANASASDLKKLMNNPDLIDVYNKWMNTHPRITKMDVKMLENCRKLQKNGIDFTSLNPGFKSYQKVVETMSTFCEKYKGLIPESEWNKIMNVMLVNGKVSDIKKALAEGMEWTLRHLNKLGKIDGDLSFEFSVKFPQGLKYKGAAPKRVADLKVCPKGKTKGCTYFEFKSVSEVPPKNFNDQFVKDLLNDDVKDLSHIKWILDGKKIPAGSDFKKEMTNAIKAVFKNSDNEDALKEAAKKILKNTKATKESLENAIIANFDEIFKLEY